MMSIFCASLLLFVITPGNGVNVALNKPASQSSVHIPYPRPASVAVDGDTTGRWPAVLSQDEHRSFAWWKVDLQQTVHNAEVKIYFRIDYIPRRNGLRLYTSKFDIPQPTSPYWKPPCSVQLCNIVIGRLDGTDIPDVYSTHCPGSWRSLIIYTNAYNDGFGAMVDFAEVEVIV